MKPNCLLFSLLVVTSLFTPRTHAATISCPGSVVDECGADMHKKFVPDMGCPAAIAAAGQITCANPQSKEDCRAINGYAADFCDPPTSSNIEDCTAEVTFSNPAPTCKGGLYYESWIVNQSGQPVKKIGTGAEVADSYNCTFTCWAKMKPENGIYHDTTIEE